jgi:Ni/Co efflux regulator RcnB
MKKLLSAGVISLALLMGSAFAVNAQDRNYDREDHQRRARVVRSDDDRDQHRRHARIVRTYGDRRVMIIRHRHQRHHGYYGYYDRQHRMP